MGLRQTWKRFGEETESRGGAERWLFLVGRLNSRNLGGRNRESGVEPPHSELGGGGAGGCFEDCEGGALRIGDYGDAADVFEIRGWHVESGTKFFGFASG
jgi:hypothetical protein